MAKSIFVQLGATRDGLDSYLSAARAHGLEAWLVDTPGYLKYRAGLPGRRRFDREIGIRKPSDAPRVATALVERGASPCLVLAGFDRYTATAQVLDARFRGRTAALPPGDKAGQREALARAYPAQPQPAFVTVNQLACLAGEVERLGGEVVVKPVNGAGGLGVYRVTSATEARAVAGRLASLRNYDGARFGGVLIEQLVPGTEYSVQGVARNGRPEVLSTCEKITGAEADPGARQLTGFRELAHIATPGAGAPADFVCLAERCLTAFGYPDGPFQIDLIRSAEDGKVYFLELGYRLSGTGIVRLVEHLTGRNWGDLAFGWELAREWPATPKPLHACVGQCLLRGPAELARAAAAARDGVVVRADVFPASRSRAPLPAPEALRHAGFVGRALVWGPCRDAVRDSIRFILDAEGERECAG
jgi:hypothetical protein